MPDDRAENRGSDPAKELSAARDREAATREILQVISQSRNDEMPVFDTILECAARLCDAQAAGLQLLNDAGSHVRYVRGWPDEGGTFQPGFEMAMDGVNKIPEAIRTASVINIGDLKDSDLYKQGYAPRVQLVDEEGIRSWLIVPLLGDDGAFGTITLSRFEVIPFTKDEVALIETFAAQAVIAIDNVRQFRELQTRLEREAATRDILEVISQSRADEMPVLETIVRNAARLCDAELAGLSLANEARTQLHYACVWGPSFDIFEVGYQFDLNGPLQVATTVREARIIHTPDLADDPLYIARDPVRVKIVEEVGVRSFLTVPLVRDGVAFGCLNLNRFDVKPFAETDIRLIETFAEQAVIAIDNVQQFREVQERLERERASAEILHAVSQNRDDEQPVFDVILDNACRLCDAPFAGLYMLDETRAEISLVASLGARTEYLKGDDRRWPINDPASVGVAIREGRIEQAEDIRDTDAYRNGNKQRVEAADIEGIRTFLAVPLMRNGVAIGAIGLYRREVARFQESQIALVENFATQAVIAIENVRQFRELQTRLEREAATKEVLQVISQSRDDEKPVFDAILENACKLCNAPLAYLSMATEDRTHIISPARRGAFAKFGATLDSLRVPLAESRLALARAISECRVFREDDISRSDLYTSGDPNRISMVEDEGARSLLVVPLIQNSLGIGSITLYRREIEPFSDDDVAVVENFAAQAVIAIENVRQFREVQTRLEREAAAAEILEVISRSRDDEAPVFEAILKNAALLCDAPMTDLDLVDEDGVHLREVATWGPIERAVPSEEWVWRMDSDYSHVIATREGNIAHVPDLRLTENYLSGDPMTMAAVDQEKMRTGLMVPLLQAGRGIGCLVLFRQEQKPFSDDEIKLVETFAAQAVIAIENVRQFRELQTRLEREKASREILQVISASRTDPAPVFDVILRNAALLSGAPLANLCLVNAARSHWHLVAHFGDGLRQLAVGKTTTPLESELVPAVAMRSARVVHIEDLTETDLYRQGDPGRVAMVEVEGMRTILGVPLLSDAKAIGSITLFRREVKAFSSDEIALVETFAAQAVIAIENVHQFRELQTRLEREAATKNILSVISQSRVDESPVFDSILSNASRLCDAPIAGLVLVDHERKKYELRAALGAKPEFVEALRQDPPDLDPERYVAARAIVEKRVVHIEDLASPDLYGAEDSHRLETTQIEGIRTVLFVPLIWDQQSIGAIGLWRREIKPFSEDEIALVETFAAQAVIAIENVRQFRELQTRLEREAATRDILEVISRSRDDDVPVFDSILESAARLCKASMAMLMLTNDTGSHMRMAASFGESLRSLELDELFPMDPKYQLVQTIQNSRTIQTEDMTQMDLYTGGDATTVRLVDDEGLRTRLTVPLVSGGKAIGCIVLSRRDVAPFAEADIALVETFAEQAVIAIENVRQFNALEARTAEVESLNTGLENRVATQVDELERMGRLKRFLSPQVADAVVSSGDTAILGSHRALIATLFCDIRGFTAFCERAEPEETIEVLQTYHEAMGALIAEHGAGVDHRSGDGIMVIFNDPLPCDDPAGDALRMGFAMRARMTELSQGWRRLGHRLGFGVGISLGYATVGMVGSEGRYDYTASGTSVNLAARLCDHAEDGEILLSPRAFTAVEDWVEAETVGALELKGIGEPVEVFRAIGLRAAE